MIEGRGAALGVAIHSPGHLGAVFTSLTTCVNGCYNTIWCSLREILTKTTVTIIIIIIIIIMMWCFTHQVISEQLNAGPKAVKVHSTCPGRKVKNPHGKKYM